MNETLSRHKTVLHFPRGYLTEREGDKYIDFPIIASTIGHSTLPLTNKWDLKLNKD